MAPTRAESSDPPPANRSNALGVGFFEGVQFLVFEIQEHLDHMKLPLPQDPTVALCLGPYGAPKPCHTEPRVVFRQVCCNTWQVVRDMPRLLGKLPTTPGHLWRHVDPWPRMAISGPH